jgi:hypothetical protein
MTEQEQIAKTILQQIAAGEVCNKGRRITGLHAMFCWGKRGGIALPRTKEQMGGVRFHVNGNVHKGTVTVKLAWDDTYTIELHTPMPYSLEETLARQIPGIYFDQLAEVIDRYVESGD